MADHPTLTHTLLSQSHSPSGTDKDGEFDEDGYEKSSLFYDPVVLDSPIRENETLLEESCFDTQVVDTDHSDDRMGHMEPCELDDKIVLDSEDEGSCRITSRSGNNVSRYRDGRIPCLDAADSVDKQLGAVRPNSNDGKQEGDHKIGRLEFVDSREFGESSEATAALCFVDNFLSFNVVDMCQGVEEERTRAKSPFVSSAKGTRRLAKIIERGSPVEETGAFEWIESCQQAEADTFIKRGSNHSLSVFKDQCSGLSIGVEKESEGNDMHGSFKEFDELMPTKPSSEKFEVGVTARDVPDMFDVGIGTQIAAEAMEALYYGLPPSRNTGDTCEGLGNTFTDLQEGDTKGRTCLEQNSLPKVAKEFIRRKRSARRYNKDISGSSWNFDYQKLSHKIEPNGYKCKQSKVDESVSNNLKKCENYVSPSILDERTLLRKQPSHKEPRVMTNNVNKESLLTYKRKRKRVVADPPPKLLSGKQKCSNKLHSYASTEATDGKPSEQQQSSPEEAAIARLLRLDSWNFPKGKRTYCKVPIHLSGGSNMHASVTSVGAEEQNLDSVRSQKLPEDGETNSSNSRTTLSCKKSVNMAPLNNRSYLYQRRPCNRNLPKPSLLKELIELGIPELISDLSHRGSRTRKELAHVRVLFSQHLDDDVIKQQKKISARLGISITSCSTDATHFVADKFVRTRNMLEAIAVGKPVVTPLWLDSCGQASCLLDEKRYILRDAKKEKEIGFSMAISLARARQYPLLKDKKVCITQNVKPNKEIITSLVKAVGGEVCVPTSMDDLQLSITNGFQILETNQKMTARDEKIQVDLLILSCEQDLPICTPLLEKGAAVYCLELLLNGIVIQKLEYGRHQLLPKFMEEKSGRSRKR